MMGIGDLRRATAAVDSTTRGWGVLFAGEVARMALAFIAGVLIARALGPEHFGVYVVLGAATAIGSVLADLGLSQSAVVRVAGVWATDEALARQRGQTFVWVRFVTAAAVTLPAVLLARWLVPIIGLPDLVGGYRGSSLLVLALAGVVASSLSGAISTLFQATGRFGSIAVLLLTNTGLTLCLAGILIIVGRLDLMTVVVVLGILPSLITFVVGRRLMGGRWRLVPPNREALVNEAGALFRIGWWLWLAGLLSAVAVRLDLMLVNRMSPPEVVGVYGLAFSLATSLGATLYTVLLPAASALRERAEYRDYLRSGLLRSGVISLMLVPLALLARPFIVLVYGSDYASAVPLFQLFIPVAALELLVMPLMLLVVPRDLPQWLAGAGALRVIVVAVLGWGLIPLLGPSGAIVARAASVVAGAGLVAVVLAKTRGRHSEPVMVDPLTGYASWAGRYPSRAHNPLMVVEQDAMVRLLPDMDGATCLDLACGSGRYLRILAQKGAARAVGIDAVPRMLTQARQLKPPAELVQGHFECLPFPDMTFEVVVCGLAVGHAPDLDAVVSEAARVLRPGGVLLYSDFHPRLARAGGERTFTADDGIAYRVEHNIHEPADHRRACRRAGLTIDTMLEPEMETPLDSPGEQMPVALVVRATRDGS